MWFPLAFQVQYRDFYLFFYHLFVILCGLQGVPVAFITFTMLETVTDCSNSHYLHYLRFLATGMACTANVQCISM